MQFEELVTTVRHQLSEEDRRLLRAAYTPTPEEAYDELFDRVLLRIKTQLDASGRERRSH